MSFVISEWCVLIFSIFLENTQNHYFKASLLVFFDNYLFSKTYLQEDINARFLGCSSEFKSETSFCKRLLTKVCLAGGVVWWWPQRVGRHLLETAELDAGRGRGSRVRRTGSAMNMARLRNCTIGLTPRSHYTARFKLSLCITVLLSGCLAKLGVARGCRGGIAGGIMGVTPHSPTHIKRTHTLASERRSVCFLGV